MYLILPNMGSEIWCALNKCLGKREGRRGREIKGENNSSQASAQNSRNTQTWIDKEGNETSGLPTCFSPFLGPGRGPGSVFTAVSFP